MRTRYEVPSGPIATEGDPRDPLSGPASSGCYWTTVNAGEAIQGIPTPLSFSWYNIGSEIALRRCFADLGALSSREIALPTDNDQRFVSICQGRVVLNVDVWRAAGDLMPGSSGNAVEEQFFGAVRPGQVSHSTPRRYPVVAIKAPLSLYLKQRRMRQIRAEFEPWRLQALRDLGGGDTSVALRLLDDALQRFIHDSRHHVAASMLSQSLYQQLGKLAESAGRDGLELSLTTGYGSLEESAVLAELWSMARAGEDVTRLATRYGYYGTNTGEMASPSWREDPASVIAIAERYRALADERDPAVVDAKQQRRRREAEAELLGALPAGKRELCRVVMKLASVYLPLREVGRAALLMTLDVGRASARLLGQDWVDRGRLDAPDDIFYLTHQEVVSGQISRELIAYRRERRAFYQGIDLPEAWQGVPEVIVPTEDSSDDVVVTGLGANDGVIEGTVRVMSDQDDTDFEDGEVLVCRTTDPSWASLLLMAGAAVIDIGGPLSHGAIVARELGIPCVIGTKDGTRRLRTGDVVRVDGGAGRVERIKAAD